MFDVELQELSDIVTTSFVNNIVRANFRPETT